MLTNFGESPDFRDKLLLCGAVNTLVVSAAGGLLALSVRFKVSPQEGYALSPELGVKLAIKEMQDATPT